MTTATDEYYRDIIEGLALYTGSALQRDVLATITRHAEPDLGGAFNKNQIASKMWLADALHDAVGPNLGEVAILGGWFGVLAAVLLHDPRFAIERILSIDIDPRCAEIARSVNATHVRAGRFAARTADMLELDYGPGSQPDGRPLARPRRQHELRAPRAIRPLVRARTGRAAAGPPVERLFRLRAARQLRSRSRVVPRPGADARRPLRRRAPDAALRPVHADRGEVTPANAVAASTHAAAPCACVRAKSSAEKRPRGWRRNPDDA